MMKLSMIVVVIIVIIIVIGEMQLKAMFRNAMTKWTFLPSAAPHMGRLHEAAIKSAKYHLRRVIETHQLTFEQLQEI